MQGIDNLWCSEGCIKDSSVRVLRNCSICIQATENSKKKRFKDKRKKNRNMFIHVRMLLIPDTTRKYVYACILR